MDANYPGLKTALTGRFNPRARDGRELFGRKTTIL